MASNLSILNSFVGLSTSEKQTASDEMNLIGDALLRKSKCLEDDMAIAMSLERVAEQHTTSSNLYQQYLAWLGEVSPSWQDKQYRKRIKKAYKGLKVIQSIGAENEIEKSVSRFQSNSALAEVVNCKEPIKLAKALQRGASHITAGQMKQFNKTGSFSIGGSNSTPYETQELTEEDKVLLLNLYIDNYIKQNPIPNY